MSPNERTALFSALNFGKSFAPALTLPAEVLGIAIAPPPKSIRAPVKMPVGFAFSKSGEITMAGGLTGTAFAAIGIIVSGGVWASTTRDAGTFVTTGSGFFTNVGASFGPEVTVILGTSADLSGPYFSVGVGVSGPSFIGVGGALLFSPSSVPRFIGGPGSAVTLPLTLTLMGYSFTVTANTPSPIPTTVVLEVTDTKVWPKIEF